MNQWKICFMGLLWIMIAEIQTISDAFNNNNHNQGLVADAIHDFHLISQSNDYEQVIRKSSSRTGKSEDTYLLAALQALVILTSRHT